VLSATTPFGPELARSFERLAGAPVIEIYGATEAGSLATREPARGERFTPLDGIVANMTRSGLVVRGGQVDGVVTLSDRASVHADGSFTLTGRNADMVKVGGKRASIAMLNRSLETITGVVDGAFVVVDGSALTPRLAALAVAPGLDRATILAALRERIDPVFLPRPLHLVDALPRNALGKLSSEAMRKRLAELSTQAAIGVPNPSGAAEQATKRQRIVPASHPALAGHFPGRPIVPAAWLLTLVEEACRERFGDETRVCGIVHARFRAPLAPDTPFAIELERGAEGRIAFRCVAGAMRVADGVLVTADGR
jgi:3-hydroxymyristoyl/3-hydroxydecanoyl-(acyl carrier protein) dehydratase